MEDHLVAREESFECISPTIEQLRDKQALRMVIASHDWDVDDTQKMAGDQILARIHCARCGLNRVFIVSNIDESKKRAQEIREKERLRQSVLMH